MNDVFAGDSLVPVLNEEGCEQIVHDVHRARSLWRPRHGFYTLGAASYLDTNPGDYQQNNHYSSEAMRHIFSDLYDEVCAVISGISELPSKVHEQLGPPGFHIFRGHPLLGSGLMHGGSIHIDTPHLQHAQLLDPVDDVLAFTLPVALPAGGGGMFYWTEETSMDVCGFPSDMDDEQLQWLETNKKQIDYRLGHIALHDGKSLHQLASLCEPSDRDWRITLQGHGVLSDGVWHLYF